MLSCCSLNCCYSYLISFPCIISCCLLWLFDCFFLLEWQKTIAVSQWCTSPGDVTAMSQQEATSSWHHSDDAAATSQQAEHWWWPHRGQIGDTTSSSGYKQSCARSGWQTSWKADQVSMGRKKRAGQGQVAAPTFFGFSNALQLDTQTGMQLDHSMLFSSPSGELSKLYGTD